MTLRQKMLLAAATLASSKQAVASTFLGGILGAGLASTMGFDPYTWIWGAIGGVIVRVKLPATTRIDSIVNGVISVSLAGLGAPWVAKVGDFYKFPTPSVYLIAFVLAVLWPWLISLWPSIKQAISTKLEKWGNS